MELFREVREGGKEGRREEFRGLERKVKRDVEMGREGRGKNGMEGDWERGMQG